MELQIHLQFSVEEKQKIKYLPILKWNFCLENYFNAHESISSLKKIILYSIE